MFNIEITAKARIQLTQIGEYTYLKWGKRQATIYIDENIALFDFLAQNPQIGLCRDEIYQGLRSFPHKSHIIYY